MVCLLMYDIADDGARLKVADACLDYGLDRVQFSVFCGAISRNYQEALFQKVVRVMGKKPGHIQLIPICQTDWSQKLVYEVGDG